MLVRDIQVVSNSDSPSASIDLHTTKSIRVEEDNPILQRAIKLDALCTPDRDYYLLPCSASTENTICASQQYDSLTLSEDSDTTRIYDLNSRETKILRHDIIKKSKKPVGEATGTPPTSPIDSELFHINPSIGLDKTIQQLTSKLLDSAKDIRRPIASSPSKLRPNLFTQAEAQQSSQKSLPKNLKATNRITKKMASAEVVLPVAEVEKNLTVAERATNGVVSTNGEGVANVDSATNVTTTSNVTNETTTTETADAIERSEAVIQTSAELVEHKEASTSEEGDRTVTQETSVTSSVERNQATVVTEAVSKPSTDSSLVSSGEHSMVSETTSAEEFHRSESTVVTTEEDTVNNVMRTITVTTSLVGVKQRILSETLELVSSNDENYSISEPLTFNLAIENNDVFGSAENPTTPTAIQHAQIVSETLKTPVPEENEDVDVTTTTGLQNEAKVLRQFSYPPQGDVVVVSH